MRHRFSLVAAAALVLAACSDDPGTSPTGVGATSDLSAVTATCEPATIRYTLANLLTDAGSKAFAIPHFNAGQQADAAGNAALAEREYFQVVNHVLDRYVHGGTAQPKRYESIQSAVYWVVLALYDCADAQLPIAPEDLLDLIDDIGGGGPTGDIGIGVVGPGVAFDIVTASKQFSFSGGGDYWDEAGIVVLRRISDADDFSPAYNEYPPRYNITVTPYSAHEDYDSGAEVNQLALDDFALVSICAGEHPNDHEDLFILRRREAPLTPGLEELPFVSADPDVVCDPTLPDYSPTTDLRLGSRGMGAVRGLLASVWRHLGPAPLYAVDGGIGGRVRLASDYVSAEDAPAPPTFAFARLVTTTTGTLFQPIAGNILSTTEGQQWELAASTSSAEVVVPTATCAWSVVSNPTSSVALVGAILTAEDPGTAVIRATCGTSTVDVTVNVSPVIIS